MPSTLFILLICCNSPFISIDNMLATKNINIKTLIKDFAHYFSYNEAERKANRKSFRLYTFDLCAQIFKEFRLKEEKSVFFFCFYCTPRIFVLHFFTILLSRFYAFIHLPSLGVFFLALPNEKLDL